MGSVDGPVYFGLVGMFRPLFVNCRSAVATAHTQAQHWISHTHSRDERAASELLRYQSFGVDLNFEVM